MFAPTPYTIRPATLDDIPGILALMRQSAGYEKLTDIFAATEDSLRPSLFGRTPVVGANEMGKALAAPGGYAWLTA